MSQAVVGLGWCFVIMIGTLLVVVIRVVPRRHQVSVSMVGFITMSALYFGLWVLFTSTGLGR